MKDMLDFSTVVQVMNCCSRKSVISLAKKILKKAGLIEPNAKRKFSLQSKKDVEEVYQLAAYLFIFEEYTFCYSVCDIFRNVCFTGNYDVWHFIRQCRTMQSAILRMTGDNENADLIIDALLPHESSDLYINAWKNTYENAQDLERHYQEAKLGMRTPSVVRRRIVTVAMTCNFYIQIDGLPEYHKLMKEWLDRISEFLRKEEP